MNEEAAKAEEEVVDTEATNDVPASEDPVTPETDSGDQAGAPVEGEAVDGAAEEDDDPITALQKEAEKWREVAVRATADLENYRKRMAREKTEAIRYANAGLLEGLLPVIDNFEWGLQAAKAESESSSIFQGMTMVHKQITDFLAAEGVEPVASEGETFDPNLHDAVSQEASDSVPEGTIIQQTRRGYRLRDRLLRPAGVVVSTGVPTGDDTDPQGEGDPA